MKTRLVLTALLVMAVTLVAIPTSASAQPNTWYVSPSGNDISGSGTEVNPWHTIGKAVSEASGGDTIKVMDDDDETTDDYTENIIVNKSLTIERHDAIGANPQVKALYSNYHVFDLTANNASIRGLDVYGATGRFYAGIHLRSVSGCTIEDNRCGWDDTHGNWYGIRLFYSSNNTVLDNTCSENKAVDSDGIRLFYSSGNTLSDNICNGNGDNGIELTSSSDNTLWGNTCNGNVYHGICAASSSDSNILWGNACNENNGVGIVLFESSDNTLLDNIMSENAYNFGVNGSSLSYFTHNIDTTNKVNGKPVYYWVSQQDQQIPNDAGYVGVVNSTGITVRDLTLTNNMQGVLFAYTSGSTIGNVTASNNWFGIHLTSSSDNTLWGNTCNENNFRGINLVSSSDNTISGNTCNENNYRGIVLASSSNNTLLDNIMSENAYNFGVNGSSLSHYTHNIDTTNKVDGKPVYYWVSQQDQRIPNDAGYVGVVNSTGITVRDLTLTNNIQGVLFAYTSGSTIGNVTASNNWRGIVLISSSDNTLWHNTSTENGYDGIRLWYSSDNTLWHNTCTENDEDGIVLASSSDNTLWRNTCTENDSDGIVLASSSGNNTLCLNNFSDNTVANISSTGLTITWNSLEQMTYTYDGESYTNYLGNYYSDYSGFDDGSGGRIAGDGIGDTDLPYATGGSGDNYPLMEPWENYITIGDLDVFNWVKVGRIILGLDDPTPGADVDQDGDVDVFDLIGLIVRSLLFLIFY